MNIFIGEINKVKKNLILLILLLLEMFFILYIFTDAKTQHIVIDGYLISSGLLSYTLFGIFIPILVGSLIIYNDNIWNTFIYLNTIYSRGKIYFIKIISIIIFSLLILLFTYLFMFLLVILNNYEINTLLIGNIINQILLVWFILSFWGIFSFVLTLVSNNILFGVVFTTLYSFSEIRLWNKIDSQYLKFLPVYNQKSMLYHSFSNLKTGSLIIVPIFNYKTSCYNLFYLLVLFIIIVGLGYLYLKNKDDITKI